MYNHEPEGYECSLCEIVRGEDNADPWAKQSDVVFRDDDVVSWINPKWWGRIEGNVVVVPNEHVENIFDVSADLASRIHVVARDVAIALMETYGCPGISLRQHNGPAGNQEVWHYHLHVFPRFDPGDLYRESHRLVSVEERRPYADRLRAWFESS